ncbi:MAG: cysteine synthase family protein [Bacteriovoracaceae bacterium]|nr:cysteine synthase family protein [Bacteriovoracaceae bacterium]
MKSIKANILEAIGHTPIVRLNKVAKNLPVEILVKCEFMNPGGSIKDRIGRHICQKAMERGELKPGGVIVEATSGNTGMGIALFAAVHGCQAIFVMSDKQSREKIDLLKSTGSIVVICPSSVDSKHPDSYHSVAHKLAKEIPGAYYADQYENEDNYLSHYYSTGPEIWEQTEGDFDFFAAGVGTGGTISGTSKFFKEKSTRIKSLGIDPEGSILLPYSKTKKMGEGAPYLVEGIGQDYLPGNVKFDLIDFFANVNDQQSFSMTRRLLKEEGIFCGGSCGAAVAGTINFVNENPTLTQGKRFVVILPDSGARYLSKLYNKTWLKEKGMDVGVENETLTLRVKEISGTNARIEI